MAATTKDFVPELALRLPEPLPAPVERRRIRRASGLTQAALADVLGVSRPALARWEAGARNPRGRARADYVRALRALAEAEAARS